MQPQLTKLNSLEQLEDNRLLVSAGIVVVWIAIATTLLLTGVIVPGSIAVSTIIPYASITLFLIHHFFVWKPKFKGEIEESSKILQPNEEKAVPLHSFSNKGFKKDSDFNKVVNDVIDVFSRELNLSRDSISMESHVLSLFNEPQDLPSVFLALEKKFSIRLKIKEESKLIYGTIEGLCKTIHMRILIKRNATIFHNAFTVLEQNNKPIN